MDYAFAPGIDTGSNKFNTLWRRIFKNFDSNVKLIDKRGVTSVETFIEEVANGSTNTIPAGNLYLGSHASPDGTLYVHLIKNQNDVKAQLQIRHMYELIEHLVIQNNIDADGIVMPRPTDANNVAIPGFFNIRGCRIGEAKPILQILQQALGGNLTVRAPKHFDEVQELVGVGVFEYMSYSLHLNKKDPFLKYADALAAFKASGLKYIDGTTIIPAADWDKWFGKWKPKLEKLKVFEKNKAFGANNKQEYVADLPYSIDSTIITTGKENFEIAFRYNYRIVYDYKVKLPTGTAWPGTLQGQIDLLKESIQFSLDNNFPFVENLRDTHAFPLYKRMGYSSRDEFINNLVWVNSVNTKKEATFTGCRHEYTAIIPITQVGTDKLFHNFTFDQKQNTPFKAPFIQIRETDSRFYETA